jgi:hypothetical protein
LHRQRSDDGEQGSDEVRAAGLRRIYRLHYRFLRASQEIDPNPWDHDRYDVATGITWRILRTAAHIIDTRSLWSEEHGYPAIRSLFDSYVQLKWMLAVEADRPGVWREFKNYGRGRNKALLLHTKDVMSRVDGEPHEILEGLIPKLESDANRENPVEFQDITIANTFAGDKSLLEMATEVGLADMYHSVMIPASSALHGDWSALTEHVLDPCLHPLHDEHFVPRTKYADDMTEQFPFLAESFGDWVFDDYCRAMAKVPLTNEEAEAEMHTSTSEAPPSRA